MKKTTQKRPGALILIVVIALMVPLLSLADENPTGAADATDPSDDESADPSDDESADESDDESADEVESEDADETDDAESTESDESAPADIGTETDTDPEPEAEPANETTEDESSEEPVEMVAEVQVSPAQSASGFDDSTIQHSERAINILTARTTRKGALLLVIDHRAYDTFISDNAFFDYLGLDTGNLRIGLGLRYGILDFLDAGFYRLNNGIQAFDTYEWDARVRFLNQDRHFVDASVRAGFSWFVQPDVEDASGFFGQLVVNRIFWDRLLVGTGFAVHTNSSNDEKSIADDNASGAVLGFVEWRITPRFALDAEIAASVAGYRSEWPVFGFSAKMLTHRHSFSITVSNSQYMAADGQVANSWRGFSDLVFGLQIVREFTIIEP